MGLLRIDDGLAAGNIGLERAHLRCLQGEPQSQLALAQRCLGFFQVGDIDDGTDRAHGPPSIGRVAIVPPPLNGHPPHAPSGRTMRCTPLHFPSSADLPAASTLAVTAPDRAHRTVPRPPHSSSPFRAADPGWRTTQGRSGFGSARSPSRKCRYRQPGPPGAATHRSHPAPILRYVGALAVWFAAELAGSRSRSSAMEPRRSSTAPAVGF